MHKIKPNRMEKSVRGRREWCSECGTHTHTHSHTDTRSNERIYVMFGCEAMLKNKNTPMPEKKLYAFVCNILFFILLFWQIGAFKYTKIDGHNNNNHGSSVRCLSMSACVCVCVYLVTETLVSDHTQIACARV